MNLEDTRHNLAIVGKIFIVLGFIIIPLVILSYNSINFLFHSDWFHFTDHITLGVFRFSSPFKLFYVIPIFYLTVSLLLLLSGFGLISNQSWAKKLALIPAVILLFKFPIGTALGIFLIYLVQSEKKVETNLDGTKTE